MPRQCSATYGKRVAGGCDSLSLSLSLSSVFRDGESFLSGQARRRGRGWVRTPEGRTLGVRQGAGTATRARANGEEEESFLRPLLCRAPPLLCSPLPLSLSLHLFPQPRFSHSVSRWFSEVVGRRERGALNGERECVPFLPTIEKKSVARSALM